MDNKTAVPGRRRGGGVGRHAPETRVFTSSGTPDGDMMTRVPQRERRHAEWALGAAAREADAAAAAVAASWAGAPLCRLRLWSCLSPATVGRRPEQRQASRSIRATLAPSGRTRRAEVTDADAAQVKVHYEGFDAGHDEWIDHSSPRLQRAEAPLSAAGLVDHHAAVVARAAARAWKSLRWKDSIIWPSGDALAAAAGREAALRERALNDAAEQADALAGRAVRFAHHKKHEHSLSRLAPLRLYCLRLYCVGGGGTSLLHIGGRARDAAPRRDGAGRRCGGVARPRLRRFVPQGAGDNTHSFRLRLRATASASDFGAQRLPPFLSAAHLLSPLLPTGPLLRRTRRRALGDEPPARGARRCPSARRRQAV
eukprot:gene58152-biopygen7089